MKKKYNLILTIYIIMATGVLAKLFHQSGMIADEFGMSPVKALSGSKFINILTVILMLLGAILSFASLIKLFFDIKNN
ncbi:hypothetical protein PT070_05570 [Erysipelothrix rhusiopathiae]|nr:hypothetical protein [Erysipelothrix rhusiopathiae]MDE8078735.1 hypothetical protein [Erysipelothrix rhusiopathiae]MDE8083711.1 hypothetical protein [Erysipelothrix rhusiopathiae]MDE8093738.1 hypothetical protein [Erysipelothrix rhusiopathiae]MDE8161138.1 hypothetical protein [Erysipelothrix rhusiopathiae]